MPVLQENKSEQDLVDDAISFIYSLDYENLKYLLQDHPQIINLNHQDSGLSLLEIAQDKRFCLPCNDLRLESLNIVDKIINLLSGEEEVSRNIVSEEKISLKQSVYTY